MIRKTTTLRDRVLEHLAILRIPIAGEALDQILDAAERHGLATLDVLDRLLGEQAARRRDRGIARRIAAAQFAEHTTLDTFDWAFNKTIKRRKVAIRRPRVRAADGEVPLPTFQTLSETDPLNRRVVDQMLVGVATRQYARSLDPLPAGVSSRGTSKSSVSRRFVAKTAAQFEAWQASPLDTLDLVGLIIDGLHIGEHCLVVALGIAADGQKHALGLWEGSTENATLCQSLLTNLQSRGLRTDRSLLVILDGSGALRKAVRATCGDAALVQRCQVHKLRNVMDHLPERQRPWVRAIMQRAYQSDGPTARRLLQDLARRLEDEYPSAAASVREGLDETLTVQGLGLSERLQRSLATTNAAESLISRTRHVKRNVKRWRGGKMMLRWVAAGVLEAVKGFRRLKGYRDMPRLAAYLRARDQQLGLAVTTTEVNVA